MSHDKRFQRISEAARNVPIPTHIINPDVARKLHLIFSFQWLDLKNKKPFICTDGHGKSLLYILETFRLLSNIERSNLELNYRNCHIIPEHQVKQHRLDDYAVKSPSGKLFQLGRKNTPERIIGYFSLQINVFQVCLLDLSHNLSGD